jgi:hypothetical protein
LFLCYFNRDIFPSDVRLFVQNDVVAALASGRMGKLHECVLIVSNIPTHMLEISENP